MPDVLTLEEVSLYLRLPPEIIMRQVSQGNLPGRKIEDTWRFLKTAIDDWLRTQGSRAVLLQQAGIFADDDTLIDLRTEVYRARGRAEVESDDA